MVGARTAAMGLNRIIDARIDAQNPRTAGRPLAGRQGHPGRIVAAGDGGRPRCCWLRRRCSIRLCLTAGPGRPRVLRPLRLLQALHRHWPTWCWASAWRLRRSGPGSPCAATSAGRSWCWGRRCSVWVAGFDIFYALQDVDFDR
ncbi:MAG: hypothetical protein MZV64_15565, partial [Ignavibacteriales bacterium]|nr:hypothetical protein [Ignavibacteriales bacterium]